MEFHISGKLQPFKFYFGPKNVKIPPRKFEMSPVE